MQRDCSGSAMVEYAIGLVFFVTAVIAPVFDGKNVIELLMEAIKTEHAAYMYSSSMPL